MKQAELLSPAKDLKIGIAAINSGADAVYIGAPAFGARKAAGNSIEDLKCLVEYAHLFYCRVFVTLNTILYDYELEEAEKLIHRLYDIGVDAIIIQDPGILNLNLPPISLHASTQMHNYDLERIKFLDKIGFQRIVLARELSLEQIRAIRKEVKAELEVFVHGALCVSLSGQCYLSQFMSGRSANRGECSQPCRQKWSVKDSGGKVLIQDKHVLSLKDLNLSSYINDLIDAGVDSFKIEGRLKDENYVSNITNYYSSLINKHTGVKRQGTGVIFSSFQPDPERSFNRGYTDYFLVDRKRGMVNMDTPKSVGKYIGTVKQTEGNNLILDTNEAVSNGDGLCYFEKGELKGVRVNSVNGNRISCNEKISLAKGTEIYRNYDHRFVSRLEKEGAVRKIRIKICAEAEKGKLKLSAVDEDGISVSYDPEGIFDKATNPNQADRIKEQLMKCGDTDFMCEYVEYRSEDILFIPAAAVNAARRGLLERLVQERELKRARVFMGKLGTGSACEKEIDWHYNVVNRKAESFYREHGAQSIESGFEKNKAFKDKELMRTRYCLLFEMGRCRKTYGNKDIEFPLFMYNDKQCFRLEFDCGACFMKVIAE